MPTTDYYVASDAMGSVTAILDEDGNVIERRSYDAFGEMTCMAPDGTPVTESPTGVDVGFQGQIRDEMTGLYQMGYRWYNPVLGRWISRDPIGLNGGFNCSTFSLNKPVSECDKFGLQATPPLVYIPLSAWSEIPTAPEGNQTIGEVHSRPIDPAIPVLSECLSGISFGHLDHFFIVLDDKRTFTHGGGAYKKRGDIVIPLRIPNSIDPQKFKDCIKKNWPSIEKYNFLFNNCRHAVVETIKKCLEELEEPKSRCPLRLLKFPWPFSK